MTDHPPPGAGAEDVAALRRRVRELESRLAQCGDAPPPADSERELHRLITLLHGVIGELTRAGTLDDLCRRAVELGRQRLGYDRLGVWLATGNPWEIEGMFGTGEDGSVRDERGIRLSVRPESLVGQALDTKVPFAEAETATLLDHHAEPVGEGTHLVATLWTGEDVIGVLSADNLLRGRPMALPQREVLLLLASALGQLCSLKRAEGSFRASEAAYRTLVENLSVGAYRTTPEPDGQFRQVNPALARMFGYEGVADLRATNVKDHYQCPADREELLRALRETGSIHAREVQFKRKDGTVFWASCTATAQRDREGNVLWFDGILEDITARKQIEEDLRGALAKLREFESTVNRSPVVVFLWRVAEDWPIEFVSDNVSQFGYSAEEMMSGVVSWPGITHPDDIPRLEKEVDEYLRGGVDEFSQEYRLIAKSGEVRWVEDRNLVLRDDRGAITHVQGIVLDISERRRAQEALRKSEEEYRTLVESAGEAIATMDIDGRYLFMNTTAALRLGGTVEDYVGKTMWEVFPKPIADRQAATVREVITTGREMLLETPTVLRGEVRWYRTSVAPVRDGQGAVSAALILARDITHRRKAEEGLRRSELLYRTTIDTMSDAVQVVDADLRLTLYNDTFRRWSEALGLDALRVGRPIHEIFPFLGPKVQAEYRRVLETGEPVFTEETNLINGKVIHTETQKTPILQNGQVARIVTVVRDISERKRREAELREAHGKLLSAREAERKRLAGELHDSVGQKLVALQLALQGASPNSSEARGADATDPLARISGLCRTVIREVRGLCRGLYPTTLESLGLIASLQQLAEQFRGTEVAAKVFPQDGLKARRFGGDVEIAAFRVTQEAVANALRHGRARSVEIELDLEDDDTLVLIVTDDGEGFDPERVSGSGLGLSMMGERASAVGGELRVDSRPGRTVVELRVPVAGESHAAGKGLANPPGEA